MREEQLQAFEAAVRASSIARAAVELQRSASTVSRQLASLEAEVGAPMLTRGPHGVGFTPAGQAWAGHVRDILEAMARARAAAS
jgi:DNA-binding transcriptional LysR family regulator